MSAEEFIAGIGKWEGYCVASVETEPGVVIVELKGDAKAICSGCGKACDPGEHPPSGPRSDRDRDQCAL